MPLPNLPSPYPKLFSRRPRDEVRRLADVLRNETVGGFLLLAGAGLALVWANLTPHNYQAVSAYRLGPPALHLDLSVQQWTSDGLLTIFFFAAGIELKHEFLHGSLQGVQRAAVPVAAAVGGVITPALLFLALTAADPQAQSGWAIPTATDIAFALAVLALLSSHLPTALRAFLLSLAVVDDLVAIAIIAIAYTSGLQPVLLLTALIPLALFALGAQRRWRGWLLIPFAVVCWALVHASGVHATVAGVLLGLTVPVSTVAGERHSRAYRFEHRLRPISAGVAVPVFALFATGVPVNGSALSDAVQDPVFAAILVGLIIGKTIGVFGGAFVTARCTHARLDDDLSWWDVFGLSLLAGIGFTVSLLIGELAFGTGERDDHVKVAVLCASMVAGLLASVVLRARNRVYRRISEAKGI